MSSKLLSFPQISDEDGIFRKEYPWLLSDWFSTTWTVCDPVANDNLCTEQLHFDGVLGPDKRFSDYPKIIEDIKISLVLSIELSKVGHLSGLKVNSLSMMRVHVNCLKRVYRELFDMGCERLEDLFEEEMTLLKKRLSVPEHISLRYRDKISDLFNRYPLEDLPIKSYKDNKRPASVDLEWVRSKAGAVKDIQRNCSASRSLIQQVNNQLSTIHGSFKWNVSADIEINDSIQYTKINVELLARLFRVLEAYHVQSELCGIFNHPLCIAPITTSSVIDAQKLIDKAVLSAGRTRNIPAEDFLTVMDRAVRWLVDYSDPLFDLESGATHQYENFLLKHSEQEAGKLAGGWVRLESSKIALSYKNSPFPLSGFKDGSLKATTKSKYSKEMIDTISDMLDKGVPRKEIAQEHGLTKNALVGLVAKISDHRYNRNIETSGVSLNEALYSFLPLSCALIILAFTAGRESSVYGLKAGCVQWILGARFIRMFVPKTLRKDDNFPTVALVEKAVAVLERLSASARRETNDDRLFQFYDLVDRGETKGFRFDYVIDKFLDLNGIPRDEQGNHFKFSEHQFRRFFAIMYFYRFDDGDFESLSYHLRHTDWSMTEVYLSEQEAGRIFKEVEAERAASLALRAVEGDRVSGSMVGEFKEALGSSIKMEIETRLVRAMKYVDENSLVMDFVPSGLCFGRTPGREGRSQCLLRDGDDVHVMLHRATEEICEGCPNLLACDEVKANYSPSGDIHSSLVCSSPMLDAIIVERN